MAEVERDVRAGLRKAGFSNLRGEYPALCCQMVRTNAYSNCIFDLNKFTEHYLAN